MGDYPTKEIASELVIGFVGAVGTELDPVVALFVVRVQLW